MATVRDILANNPHVDAFSSIIAYLDSSDNPFERIAVANMIYQRQVFWGSGEEPIIPTLTGQGKGKAIATTNYQVDPQIGSIVISDAARNARYANPYSVPVNSFKRYLAQISTGTINAWVHFQQAVQVFYQALDSVSFILNDYKLGLQRQLFLDIMGLYSRPGAALDGLALGTVTDGIAAASKAVTAFTHDGVSLVQGGSDSSKYVAVYTSDGGGLRNIFYTVVGTDPDVAPTLPPAVGYVDQAFPIAITSGAPFGTQMSEFRTGMNAVTGTSLLDAAILASEDTINVSPAVTGPMPASEFDLPNAWTSNYTDGNPGPATAELITIDFNEAVAGNLNSRWFGLYDTSGNHYVIYFDVDGNGVAPGVGGSFSETPIAISSSDNKDAVASATHVVITGLGPWAGQVSGKIVTISNKFPGDTIDPNEGTITVFNGAITTIVSAGDGSTIASGIAENDTVAFQTANNDLRAVYDETFNLQVYMDSISNFNDGVTRRPGLGLIYRFFHENIEVATLNYNTPGNVYVVVGKIRDKSI